MFTKEPKIPYRLSKNINTRTDKRAELAYIQVSLQLRLPHVLIKGRERPLGGKVKVKERLRTPRTYEKPESQKGTVYFDKK